DGYTTTNTAPYHGFLLYAVGFRSDVGNSAGSGSPVGNPQTSDGAPLTLPRSGTIMIDVDGDYHIPGWFLSESSDDWWHDWMQEMDLLHMANHETGHALVLSGGNPRAAAFRNAGFIDDDRVRAYLGENPRIDKHYHLPGVIDPESGRGAFGSHGGARMPMRRWLPTKLDLLI